MSTATLPPEGWAVRKRDGRVTWTSHDPFARPAEREGYKAWFIARFGNYVTYVYKTVEES